MNYMNQRCVDCLHLCLYVCIRYGCRLTAF
nr:MAG TPA: hypothetical protein [Caudoviricetes sp.]